MEHSDNVREINWPRLKHAYRVVSGKESLQVDLSDWVCGTVACAAGWCAQDPQFIEEGLTLHHGKYCTHPSYMGMASFESLALFFGLTYDQVQELFSQRKIYDDEAYGYMSSDLQVWQQRMQRFTGRYGVEL